MKLLVATFAALALASCNNGGAGREHVEKEEDVQRARVMCQHECDEQRSELVRFTAYKYPVCVCAFAYLDETKRVVEQPKPHTSVWLKLAHPNANGWQHLEWDAIEKLCHAQKDERVIP